MRIRGAGMAKKSFRPQKTASPKYPRLREVDRSTVSRWGLLTLGGLLISSAPALAELPPGEPPATRAENNPPASKAKTSPDAALPMPPAPPVLGGAPEPQRVEKPAPAKPDKSKKATKKAEKKNKGKKKDPAAQEQKGTTGSAKADNTEPVSPYEGLKGKVRMPRVEDNEPEATVAPPPAVPPPTGTMPAPRVHKKGAK
jgi:hypothetical protein